MKGGRHSANRSRLSLLLVVVLGTGGWWAVAGDAARADSGRAVAICCAWGNRLADGVLTFSVTGDDPTALSIIRQAVQAWDDTLPELSFSEVTTRPDKADIVITYGPGTADGGEAPSSTGARGLTTTYMNTRRLVHKVEIGIDGGPAPVSAGAIEEIAKHELGHALGSGHANWDGDLMSPLVNPTPAPIPACDINAVRVANSWKMSDHARRAKPAPATSTPC